MISLHQECLIRKQIFLKLQTLHFLCPRQNSNPSSLFLPNFFTTLSSPIQKLIEPLRCGWEGQLQAISWITRGVYLPCNIVS